MIERTRTQAAIEEAGQPQERGLRLAPEKIISLPFFIVSIVLFLFDTFVEDAPGRILLSLITATFGFAMYRIPIYLSLKFKVEWSWVELSSLAILMAALSTALLFDKNENTWKVIAGSALVVTGIALLVAHLEKERWVCTPAVISMLIGAGLIGNATNQESNPVIRQQSKPVIASPIANEKVPLCISIRGISSPLPGGESYWLTISTENTPDPEDQIYIMVRIAPALHEQAPWNISRAHIGQLQDAQRAFTLSLVHTKGEATNYFERYKGRRKLMPANANILHSVRVVRTSAQGIC